MTFMAILSIAGIYGLFGGMMMMITCYTMLRKKWKPDSTLLLASDSSYEAIKCFYIVARQVGF